MFRSRIAWLEWNLILIKLKYPSPGDWRQEVVVGVEDEESDGGGMEQVNFDRIKFLGYGLSSSQSG